MQTDQLPSARAFSLRQVSSQQDLAAQLLVLYQAGWSTRLLSMDHRASDHKSLLSLIHWQKEPVLRRKRIMAKKMKEHGYFYR